MSLEKQLDEALGTLPYSVPDDRVRDDWEKRNVSPISRMQMSDLDRIPLRPGKIYKSNKFYELWINRDIKEKDRRGGDPDRGTFWGTMYYNRVLILPTAWLVSLPERVQAALTKKSVPIPGPEDVLPDKDVFAYDNLKELDRTSRGLGFWSMDKLPWAEKMFDVWSRETPKELSIILQTLGLDEQSL